MNRVLRRGSIRRTLRERKNADYDDLIDLYGNEFLSENYPDDEVHPMSDLDYTLEAMGDDDIEPSNSFSKNDDYYYTNDYGNLVSINEWQVHNHLVWSIPKSSFLEWCEERSYIDSFEDYEYDAYHENDELNESVRRPSRKRLSEKVNPYANMDIQIYLDTANLDISPRCGMSSCRKTQPIKDTEKYLKHLSKRLNMEQITNEVESLGFSFVASHFYKDNTCTLVYTRQTDMSNDEFDGANALDVHVTGYELKIETPW